MPPHPRPRDPSLSVVVPVLDEAECVAELAQRVREAFGKAGVRGEILFVDDGSRDAVVPMDGDLQHLPKLLPALIDAWRAVGLEVSSAAARRAAETIRAAVVAVGDAQHVPFADDCFDVVTVHAVREAA